MALDVSIYNQPLPKAPDLAGAYAKGLDLKVLAMRPEQMQAEIDATKQSIAVSQTQQAGMEFDNKLKEQAARDNKILTEITKKHLDANGKPVYATLAREAIDNNVSLKSVEAIFGAHLVNEASVADIKQKGLTNAENHSKFVNSSLMANSNIVGAALDKGMSPAEAAEKYNHYVASQEALVPGTAKYFTPATADTIRAITEAGKQASMSPAVQLEQMRAQETHDIEQQKAFNIHDIKDPRLIALQDQLVKVMGNVPIETARTLTGPQIGTWPGFKDKQALEQQAGIRPVDQRDKAAVEADVLGSDADVLRSAKSDSNIAWSALSWVQRAKREAAIAVVNRETGSNLDPKSWAQARVDPLIEDTARRLEKKASSRRDQASNRDVPAKSKSIAGAGTKTNPHILKADADYDELPSGAVFIAPNETKSRTKP